MKRVIQNNGTNCSNILAEERIEVRNYQALIKWIMWLILARVFRGCKWCGRSKTTCKMESFRENVSRLKISQEYSSGSTRGVIDGERLTPAFYHIVLAYNLTVLRRNYGHWGIIFWLTEKFLSYYELRHLNLPKRPPISICDNTRAQKIYSHKKTEDTILL